LNIGRDHKEMEALRRVFTTFRRNTRGPFLVGEDVDLERVSETETSPLGEGVEVFGLGKDCDLRADEVDLSPDRSRFRIAQISFDLSVPGLHNVRNAVAAAAACRAAGVDLPEAARALAGFRGVARRFQVVGRVRGVEVVDDFAHNPDKIGASLAAARARGMRSFNPTGSGRRASSGRVSSRRWLRT
jgi:UDP-N-acetylmuramate-alanine ligase